MSRQIQLNKRRFLISRRTEPIYTTVDDEDFDWLNQWNWTIRRDEKSGVSYANRNERGIDGKQHRVHMHREIVNAPDGYEVDHVDGDGLNNTRGNLRIVTRAENLRNRKTFKNSKSGFKGVLFNPANRRWIARINLGTFDSSEEAARAYDEAIKKLFGDLAEPNFDD